MSEVDVDEAAAAAKKLASSTNTMSGLGVGGMGLMNSPSAGGGGSGKEWVSNPYFFYSQVPPPPQWGVQSASTQLPGINFSSFNTPAAQAPVARNPNSPSTNQTQSPYNKNQFQQQSMGNTNSSSYLNNYNQGGGAGGPSPLYSNDVTKWGIRQPSQMNYLSQQQQMMNNPWNNNNANNTSNNSNSNSNMNYMNSNQGASSSTPNMNNNTSSGPKPIRFTLQAGKKHKFSKPGQRNNIDNGVVEHKSRFGPAVGLGNNEDVLIIEQNQNQGCSSNNVTAGRQGFTSPPYGLRSGNNQQSSNYGIAQQNVPKSNLEGSPTKNINYGLQNGSTWASPTNTASISSPSTSKALPSPNKKSLPSSLDASKLINADDWPPGLQLYSAKCYAVGKKVGLPESSTERLISEKVTQAFIKGDVQTKNWAAEPIPYQLAQLESAREIPGAIPGIISGKPIKPDEPSGYSGFNTRGRGGRGRGRGALSGSSRGDTKSGGGKRGGIRGRNRFRSSSTSSSRSSSSSSKDSSPSARKRLRRSGSGDKGKKKGNKKSDRKKNSKYEKKTRNKKGAKNTPTKGDKGRVPHIYTLHGQMEVDEQDTVKINARAARFAKDSPTTSSNRPSLKSRLGGFAAKQPPISWNLDSTPTDDDNGDWLNATIVGTCTTLEKRFLRLTSAPDPSTVRPVPVLKQALKLVRTKWRENEDYFYACDQLKSIRQDLTIQHVRDEFTLAVYETHARIALEKGDHEEFNQCQSQLCQLYKSMPNSPNRVEFTAYRILYYIFTANTLDLVTVLAELTDDVKKDKYISHALALRSAWALQNYSKFFKLYANAPGMASYLIDWFIKRERKNALKKITKAYRPNVPTSFVVEQLGLNLKEWIEFLQATSLESAIIYLDSPQNTKINTKDTHAILTATST